MRVLAVLLTLASSLALAQDRYQASYPISESTVASSLSERGIAIAPNQVTLPMPLTATTPLPHLEVRAIQKLSQGEFRLQLRCHQVGECMSFVALVHAPNLERSLAKVTPDVSKMNHATSANDEVHVRPGEQVVLVLKDRHMTIQLPAIARDGASAGGSVHVSIRDHNKIFNAVVVDSGVVEGALD